MKTGRLSGQELDEFAPAGATGVVIVDLGKVTANWKALRDLVAPARCAGVVKADAYGLGAEAVIPTLLRAGCQTFFVATLKEAEQARALIGAGAGQIYVLDGLLPGACEVMWDLRAIPVLSTLDEIRAWANVGAQRDVKAPCALHVDTGLNRLGLSARDVRHLAGDMHLLNNLDVTLVMSHLACADEPAHPKNAQQLSVLETLLPLLPTAPLSLAASDGLMLGPDFQLDLVRPGYALYGGQASPAHIAPVEAAVQVYARVVQVRDVAPGQTIGYSATFEPQQQSRIAVVAAGYEDGVFRHLSAASGECNGIVHISGRPAPFVGRVSMDLITVDVTDFEEQPVQQGDWAELIGPNRTIEQIGLDAGTIGYEVLTRLGRRFHRVYIDE